MQPLKPSPSTPPAVLSIAGYDPSSGAGVTADVLTARAFGCHGLSAISALTVQNSMGVARVEALSPELLASMLENLAADFPIAAVKLGMLGSAANCAAVAGFIAKLRNSASVPVVIDPVIRASSGAELLDAGGIGILKSLLIPLATVLTPNREEAFALTGCKVTSNESALAAARQLQGMGAASVVVTGGDGSGPGAAAIDVLLHADGSHQVFSGPFIDSRSTHGTGCAYSMAIACQLAKGTPVAEAVERAKQFVARAIAGGNDLGSGRGPVNLSGASD